MISNKVLHGIVERLPSKPLLSPRDVADALGTASTKPVYHAIEAGCLSAITINGRYYLSRREVIDWLMRGAL